MVPFLIPSEVESLESLQYFIQHQAAAKKATTRHKFTPGEDEKLKRLVERYGENNWNEIAAGFGTRTARQCKERFKNYLSPNLTNEPFSEQEDRLLHEKHAEYGGKWSLIASFFKTRSEVSVKKRWHQLNNKVDHEKGIKAEKLKLAEEIGNSIVQNQVPKFETKVINTGIVFDESDNFLDFLDSCTLKTEWDEQEDPFFMLDCEF